MGKSWLEIARNMYTENRKVQRHLSCVFVNRVEGCFDCVTKAGIDFLYIICEDIVHIVILSIALMCLWRGCTAFGIGLSLWARRSPPRATAVTIWYTSLSAVVEGMEIRTAPDSPVNIWDKLFIFPWLYVRLLYLIYRQDLTSDRLAIPLYCLRSTYLLVVCVRCLWRWLISSPSTNAIV
jgi:hypothetical protein